LGARHTCNEFTPVKREVLEERMTDSTTTDWREIARVVNAVPLSELIEGQLYTKLGRHGGFVVNRRLYTLLASPTPNVPRAIHLQYPTRVLERLCGASFALDIFRNNSRMVE